MSQAKVDRYKEEKRTARRLWQRRSVWDLLAAVCGWLVVIALCRLGWCVRLPHL